MVQLVTQALTWVCAQPDGAVLGIGNEEGVVRIWDLQRGEVLRAFRTGDFVVRACWLPDGRFAVAGLGGRVQIRTGDGETHLTVLDSGHGKLRDLAVDAAGGQLATCGQDGALRLWSLPSLAAIREFTGETVPAHCVGFAGDTLVGGYDDGQFIAWHRATGRRQAGGRVMRAALYSLGVAPDGRRLVFGGKQGGLQEVLLTGDTGSGSRLGRHWNDPPRPIPVNAIGFAPDGAFLAACSDGTALWFESVDATLGLSLGEPFWRLRPKPEWRRELITSAACFVPARNLIASTHFDGALRLWRGVLMKARVEFPPLD